jgi:hypothetical protein
MTIDYRVGQNKSNKKMKTLGKLNIKESKIISTNELLSIKGGSGGWTSTPHNTYVGINGDCATCCDIGGQGPCSPPQCNTEWSWC